MFEVTPRQGTSVNVQLRYVCSRFFIRCVCLCVRSTCAAFLLYTAVCHHGAETRLHNSFCWHVFAPVFHRMSSYIGWCSKYTVCRPSEEEKLGRFRFVSSSELAQIVLTPPSRKLSPNLPVRFFGVRYDMYRPLASNIPAAVHRPTVYCAACRTWTWWLMCHYWLMFVFWCWSRISWIEYRNGQWVCCFSWCWTLSGRYLPVGSEDWNWKTKLILKLVSVSIIEFEKRNRNRNRDWNWQILYLSWCGTFIVPSKSKIEVKFENRKQNLKVEISTFSSSFFNVSDVIVSRLSAPLRPPSNHNSVVIKASPHVETASDVAADEKKEQWNLTLEGWGGGSGKRECRRPI